jgi:phosphoserine phosphatase
MPKKTISELQSAEEKLSALLNKRDEINEQAFVLRSERDSLNDRKRTVREALAAARDQRDAIVAEMRLHKAKRDELQKKAKALIAVRKDIKGEPQADLRGGTRAIERQIRDMEMKHQTTPMSVADEKEFLEGIKAKANELAKMRKVLADQDKVDKEARGVDKSIDELFRQADKEHEEVVRLSDESQKFHDEASSLFKEMKTLSETADKKHQEFIKTKEEADAAHQKAMELREKVLEVRNAKRAERMEERTAVREVNVTARRVLDDKHRKEQVADEALRTLLKGGKIQIG